MGAVLDNAPGESQAHSCSLVFLHGNVATGADWQPVLDHFPDNHPAPDAPTLWDYFRAPRVHHTLSDWAAWFCGRFADSPARPTLVGYSLGGRLALHALTACPDCFSGAVIVSANTGLGRAEKVARLERDRQWRTCAKTNWRKFLDAWEAQPVFAGSTVLPDRETLAAWNDEIAAAFDVWSLGRQQDLLPRLRLVQQPVLWITGARDDRFSTIAARAAAIMPRAEHAVVAGAGHRVPWDQPAETARLIQQFVDGPGSIA